MSLEGQEAASVTHTLEAACVKHEPEGDNNDSNYELEEDMELCPVVVKEELELGPVVLQPPDAVYAFQALLKKEQTDCHTQAVADSACSVTLECIQPYLEKEASHSEEFNSRKKFESPARLGNKELKKGQAKTNKSKVSPKKNEKRKRKIIPNSDKSPFKSNQCSSTSGVPKLYFVIDHFQKLTGSGRPPTSHFYHISKTRQKM